MTLLLLTTLLLFCQKLCCIGVFCIVLCNFLPQFSQKSKKIVKFFAIFSLCVSMIYEKFEKKVCQKT